MGVRAACPPTRLVLLAVLVLAPAMGQAHALRLSRGDWSFEPGTVRARLTFFGGELPMLAPDGRDEVAALRHLAAASEVGAAGARCALVEQSAQPVEEDGVRVYLR